MALFEPFPVLITPRLVLRCFTLEDADALFLVRVDPENARFTGRPPATSRDAIREKVAQMLENLRTESAISWVISDAETGAYLGSAGLWRWDKDNARAEVGYELARHLWGRGLVTEAMRPILAFGFERMGLHSAEAKVHPDNMSSIRVLEKLGFRKEAHFRENCLNQGVFEDTAVYSRLVTD
jgi:ribosomal-protein-alanine N-acetyltransferase